MTRIAHLTDVHFGAEEPAVVVALVDELRADPPDLVVISGDLTQGARVEEFEAAREFLDSLGVPWLAVPGNHDITPYDLLERFLDPYRRWRRLISANTEPAWQDADCAVLGLNTAQRMGWHWDWSRGRVSGARLRGLLARLARVPPGKVRVVVAHHPLLLDPRTAGVAVAGGAARALRAFARAGVGLVLSGHLHRRYSRALTASGGTTLLVQGASATSWRLRGEPNAYNRITVERGGRIIVEPRTWNGRGWGAPPAAAAAPPAAPLRQTGLDQAAAAAAAAAGAAVEGSPELRLIEMEANAASTHNAPDTKNAGR